MNSCEMSECMSEHVSKELDPQIFTECQLCARHFEVSENSPVLTPSWSLQSAGVGYEKTQIDMSWKALLSVARNSDFILSLTESH